MEVYSRDDVARRRRQAAEGGGGRLGTEDEEVRLPAAEKTQDFFSP